MRTSARTPLVALASTLCALVVAALAATALTPQPARSPAAAPAAPGVTTAAAAGVCAGHAAPPPAIDSSEVPHPGQTVPAAVPVPAGPVGGAAMSGCDTVLPAGAPPAPADIGFDSWVLQDVDTGAILAAKDPHARERPASLMKLLLALVVSRNLDPGQVITGTQDDANQEGTRVGIGPGGQYTVDLLLHGLLMASGNDIAHALAMAMGGVPQTVAKMNALAHSLGALDTRAATPSGLDGPGMSASAYDLSLIFRAAIRTPVLAEAMGTARIGFPGYGGKPPLTVYNDNHLLTSYAGDFAGKTGYTDDAQHTFANAAAQQGHRIALIMMHGTNHLDGMYQNAKELMNYAFALVDAHTTAVGQLVSTSPAPLTPANALAHTTGLAAAGHPGGGTTGSTMPPPPAMSAFGNVGGPLTVLAAIAVVAIAIFAVRRQRTRLAAERRRLAERKALREAQTIRVAPVRPVAPRRPAPSDKSSTATSMTGPIWPTQDQH